MDYYKFTSSLLFSVLIMLLGCKNKEVQTPQWYKGNLHTHSYWSDGDEFPEMIMKWYKSEGYHFVALSDHNILAEGETWKNIPEKKILLIGFDEYLQEYGDGWVEYKRDSSGLNVRLKTLEEYKPLFEEEGKFLVIQSEEITTGFDNKPIHLNATNIQELIIPEGGNSVAEVLQNNIDAVLEQRATTGKPILPHINHPNFHYGINVNDIIKLTGERFFEVYNGHPSVNNKGDSLHPGTEEMWDLINIAYYNRNQPLMYGIATDDSHNYHEFGHKFSNAGRGWVMVLADSLTPSSLIDAMESGNFYASTGVTLEKIGIAEDELTVKIFPENEVNYTIEFIGVDKNKSHSEILKRVDGLEAGIKLQDHLRFVRARITSDKIKTNAVPGEEFQMAWTQPVSIH
jgi:predicted metal-dependent phosphoesterase TrpH